MVVKTVDDVESQSVEGAASPPKVKPNRTNFFNTWITRLTARDGEVYELRPESNPRWYQRLLDAGVEENGIKPVPLEYRTNTHYSNLFTIFFTCLLNLLPYDSPHNIHVPRPAC